MDVFNELKISQLITILSSFDFMILILQRIIVTFLTDDEIHD